MTNPDQARRLWQVCNQAPFIRWQLTFALHETGAESVALLLLDEDGENLVFCAAVGLHAEKYCGGDPDAALRVPMSESVGISPLAILLGKPIGMEDGDPRHNKSIDRQVETQTHSLYSIPISGPEQAVGVLNAINPHRDAADGTAWRFQPADYEILQAVADAAGIWIHRKMEAFLLEPEDRQSR